MITDTLQNALKRLFCSIGGNADNVRNKDDINAILDEMTALNIGKEISDAGTTVIANPTLAGTEADLTGLQVGDTKYKVGGTGGGGVMKVTYTYDEEADACTSDKTFAEIIAAFNAGGYIYAVYAESPEVVFPLDIADEESGIIEFTRHEMGLSTVDLVFLTEETYQHRIEDGVETIEYFTHTKNVPVAT